MRDRVAMTIAFMAAYLKDPQPCFYGCGVLVPKDDSPESTLLRRAHLEECPKASPIVKRAAYLINQNHIQPIAEEL